ncbi:GrlR family regulatory protein [Gulbenkiania mobilis]|uniref:GrlR family regulatory protein n=1 Tax=Gulbenkiania mobilis TaxID=397457 RepID=UPI0006BBB805|nr:GrlR family regulatory protein [Gulbenkiania mobilis]
MRDGLYGVRFLNGSVNFGSGTVALRDGALNGGDAGFSYQGKIEQAASAGPLVPVAGHIHVWRWNEAVASVVPGANDYQLEVSGHYDRSTHRLELQGKSPSFHGATLTISGAFLAELL